MRTWNPWIHAARSIERWNMKPKEKRMTGRSAHPEWYRIIKRYPSETSFHVKVVVIFSSIYFNMKLSSMRHFTSPLKLSQCKHKLQLSPSAAHCRVVMVYSIVSFHSVTLHMKKRCHNANFDIFSLIFTNSHRFMYPIWNVLYAFYSPEIHFIILH